MRFGQPSLNAVESPGSLFPFNDEEQLDPVTGQRGALLGRLRARGRVPRIFMTNTSAEYWRGDASLIHTRHRGPRRRRAARRGARVPVRGHAAHAGRAAAARGRSEHRRARAPDLQHRDLLAAAARALVNLDRWVSDGVEPPPSTVPRLRDGSAVTPESTAAVFGKIPGVRIPDRVSRPARLDFGPGVRDAGDRVGAAAQGGRAVPGLRLRGRRRWQRDRRAQAAGAAGAPGDLHRLEPAPSRPGRGRATS